MKTKLFRFLFILSSFFFCISVQAQTETEIMKLSADDLLKIEEIKDLDIIDSKEIINYDHKTNTTSTPYIHYSFLKVPNVDTSKFIFDSTSSNIERIDSKHIKVYSSPVLVKIDNEIKQIDTATTTKTIFENTKVITINDKIRELFFFYPAQSATSSYYSTNDGQLYYANNTWSTVHNHDGSSAAVDTTKLQVFCGKSGLTYYINRSFLEFDISSLASTTGEDIIESAKLYINTILKEVGDSSFKVIKGTQTNPLVKYDFNNYDIGTSYSDSFLIQNLNIESYEEINLNEDFINDLEASSTIKIALLSYDYDILDTAVTTYNGFQAYSSSEAGTTKDPYLLIEFNPEEEEEASSTPVNASCYPDSIDDLSVITACSFASSTGITYTNYKIPFIVWIVIAIPFLFIANRLIIEILIRIRKRK